MRISSLYIKNFKSIQELKINQIENALILVGKNEYSVPVFIGSSKYSSSGTGITMCIYISLLSNFCIELVLSLFRLILL